jgi:hypothetical protein
MKDLNCKWHDVVIADIEDERMTVTKVNEGVKDMSERWAETCEQALAPFFKEWISNLEAYNKKIPS